MIAVIIATLAQAPILRYLGPGGPESRVEPGHHLDGSSVPSPKQVSAWAKIAARVGAALGAHQVAALEVTSAGLGNSSGTKSLGESVYVATPQLLQVLGISSSEIEPNAEIVTSLPGLAGTSGLALNPDPPKNRAFLGPGPA